MRRPVAPNQSSLRYGVMKADPSRRSPKGAGGFSLLELSIVITIIAIVTGISVDMGLYTIETVKEVANNHKLNVIEQALMAYRLANERLPCPADATLAATDANYGVEANNASGTCTGGTPSANASISITGNPNAPNSSIVAEGAVPFKSLGLPESFMYDSWGHKFAYAVWTPDTAEGAFLNYGVIGQLKCRHGRAELGSRGCRD